MKLLVLLPALLFSLSASAHSHKAFTDYLKEKNIDVSGLRSHVIENFKRNVFKIDESLYSQLLSVAQSQAEAWEDSILESEYEALGDVRLDTVEELTSKGQVVGYHISYSQRAWSTSTCDLSGVTGEDMRKPESFAQCEEGRIQEFAYVTSDLNTYFADGEASAAFKASNKANYR